MKPSAITGDISPLPKKLIYLQNQAKQDYLFF